MKRQLNLSCRYICLDNDLVKLKGFRRREPDGAALYASAYRLPLQSKSVDRAMLMFVSHHIPDEALPTVISESMRILKDDGKLIFLDAVWEPKSITSRLLWKYDRGSFPRTDQVMEGILTEYGDIAHKESYAVYHHYVLCIVTHKHPTQ